MRRVVASALVALLAVASFATPALSPTPAPTPQVALTANKAGCYGVSCNGKDPSGICKDGKTVASKKVTDGMIELRWSKKCQSNWGRYTPFGSTALGYTATNIVQHARVTAWNPEGQSYNPAHVDTTWYQFGTSWSQMVDGTRKACTGVELSYSGQGWKTGVHHTDPPTGWDDKVWQWGSCY